MPCLCELVTPTWPLPPASSDLWIKADCSHTTHRQPGGFTSGEFPGLCSVTKVEGTQAACSSWSISQAHGVCAQHIDQAGSSRGLACLYHSSSSMCPHTQRVSNWSAILSLLCPYTQEAGAKATVLLLTCLHPGLGHSCGESHSLVDIWLMLFSL